MKTYITCPVSLSQKRLKLLPEIENVLQEVGYKTFVFKVGGSSKEIFARDLKQLESCDLIVAEVSEPSHGVGIELGLSYGLGLRRILLLENDKKLTKLAEGMPKTTIISYKNVEDLKRKLRATLEG